MNRLYGHFVALALNVGQIVASKPPSLHALRHCPAELPSKGLMRLDDDEPGRKGTVRIGHKLRALRVLVARYPYRFVGVQPDALTGDELYESTNNPYTLRQWRRSNE